MIFERGFGYKNSKKNIRRINLTTWLGILVIIGVFFLGLRFEKIKDSIFSDGQSLVMGEKVSNAITVEEIESRLVDIGELATVEYLYTDAGMFTDAHHIKDFKIPLTTKSFIVRWNGKIKAGIDLSKVKANVDEGSKIITITLPSAEILSHEVDENSLETLDETKNIFNQISVDDVSNFIGESKDYVEERAIKNGLLDKAINNVQAIAKEKIINITGNEYSINYEVKS